MRKDKRWIYIAILSVVVAVSWAAVSAVTKLRKSTVPPDIEKVAEPLNPNLDKSIFTILSKRK